MYIFCGGMPRAGSTVQYQLAAELVERFNKGYRMGWFPPGNLDDYLRRHSPMSEWWVIKTHVCTPGVRQRAKAGKAKSLFIYRDLRDVVVSFMFKHHWGFDQTMADPTFKQMVEHSSEWEELLGCLSFRYEDYYDNWAEMVEQISEHIGLKVSHIRAQTISATVSLSAQHIRTTTIPSKQPYDEKHLLHRGHISQTNGKPGAWKKLLAPAQADKVVQQYHDWMEAHGYLT